MIHAQMIHRESDVLIIGSGISSLTCGLLLAKAGRRVRIVERHQKAGGYLHCFERYGHRFDTGGHYVGAVGEGEPFRALLTYLGVWDDGLFLPLAGDGFDIFRFRDFEVRFPRGYEAVVATLSEQFPDDAQAVREFFAIIRGAATTFSTYNFARFSQDDDAVASLLDTSLATVVNGLTRNPRLQCVLYAHCVLHGVAPGDTPLGMHALLLDSIIRSPASFRSGGESLAHRFVAALESHGAEVLTGNGVSLLRTQGGRITEAVLDDGATLGSPLVISGIHPKATFRLLDGFRPSPAFASRLGKLEETHGILGIYAACADPLPFARDRNYYFLDWSEPSAFDHLRRGFESGAAGRLPSCAFVCRPDRDPLAPSQPLFPLSIHAPARYEDFAAWEASAARRKPRAYYEQKLRAGAESLAYLERCVPGLGRSIVRRDISTPLTNLRFNGSEQGTAYGIYHAIRNTGARSIGPRTHLQNLLLTGQNVLFPGILGASISGLRTAGNLLGIKRILKDLSPMVAL
jgi:all-trans-retinol 13,14-reductase